MIVIYECRDNFWHHGNLANESIESFSGSLTGSIMDSWIREPTLQGVFLSSKGSFSRGKSSSTPGSFSAVKVQHTAYNYTKSTEYFFSIWYPNIIGIVWWPIFIATHMASRHESPKRWEISLQSDFSSTRISLPSTGRLSSVNQSIFALESFKWLL